jgi:hypothetical protein|tara:strand:+ start:174 stop:359 length:186 start_codon:yes stop_codon:yes gene_type:complete
MSETETFTVKNKTDDDTVVEVNDLYIMISKRDGSNMRHYWKNDKDVLFVLNRLIDIYQRKR